MAIRGLTLALICCLGISQGVTWGATPKDDHSKGQIGDTVAEFSLQDYQGVPWELSSNKDNQLTVVVFMGTECPLVKLYTPKLNELQKTFGDRLRVVGINSNQQDSLLELEQFCKTQQVEFPILKDPGNRVADLFGAERTPETYVLDSELNIRYRGRIDDQYTYGLQKPQVQRRYVAEAIEALLEGNEVKVASTEVVGCHIGRLLEPDSSSEVTYANQVSRILAQHCVECHREGEIGPFSLTDFDEVVGWAEMIAEVVEEERMPPWHASGEHGNFSNDPSLTDNEKQLISDWVAAGAPLGDVSQLPPAREFTEGWQIGEPDLVVAMDSKPFTVKAEGTVPYVHFVVDPGFTEDKWIQAAECRPGNRSVVHHIIVEVVHEDQERGRANRAESGEIRSEWICATAPGAKPMILPDGYAKRVPAGSKLRFQLHYTPNGREQTDLSKIGLVFADAETVEHEVFTQLAANGRFVIPPGDPNKKVDAYYRFDEDSVMLTMFPHMHLRGKSFRYTAKYPDGSEEILVDIPAYDFNWQNAYRFEKPKRMPAGTLLHCVAHFDNSADNFANPDPKAEVRWGDQTWEEMMIGYFDMYRTRADGPAEK